MHFESTLFVSVFQGSLLVIALFRAIVDQFSSNIFLIFLILVSWKNKAISASCPLQKYHSSSRFPSLFLSSLESFSVLFLQAKRGKCVALWFALTPPPLKWLTEQKNPLEVCKHAARYNEFGYKSDKELSKIPATYKPRKTVQKAHYIPRRDELSYVGLVLFLCHKPGKGENW